MKLLSDHFFLTILILVIIYLVFKKIISKKIKEGFWEISTPALGGYNPLPVSNPSPLYRTSVIDPWNMPPIRRTFYYRGYVYPYGARNWQFYRNYPRGWFAPYQPFMNFYR